MRNMALVVVVVCIGELLLAAPASAETTLFSDNFESQPSDDVSLVAYPDATVAADPVAASGRQWNSVVESVQDVQVTNYATPGGAGGTGNYLRIVGNTPHLASYAKATFTEQSTLGDRIRLEADVFIPTVGFLAPYLSGFDADGHREFGISASFPTNPDRWQWYSSADDDNHAISGLALPTGAWTHLQMDWKLGDSTLAMTVGSTSATVPVDPNNNGKLASWQFFGGYYDGATTYVDNVKVTLNPVPEPTSIVLLVSAMVGMAACALRKRR